MRDAKKNLILNLSIELSLEIISFCEELKSNRQYDLSSQIFRSGTSIGANIHEAQNAESMKDFIHKFKIAAKEADELQYWLTLCKQSDYLTEFRSSDKLKDIQNIISKIIISSKQKAKYNINYNNKEVRDIQEVYESIEFPHSPIPKFSN